MSNLSDFDNSNELEGDLELGEAGSEGEFDEDDEHEFDENEAIDQMLEKPVDILDNTQKDQVNFYTYDKLQIKSK